MKKLFFSVTVVALLTTFVGPGCVFPTDPGPIPMDEVILLPPVTVTGNNSFGCLINRMALYNANTESQPIVSFANGKFQLSFQGLLYHNYHDTIRLGAPLYTVTLNITKPGPLATGIYDLNNYPVSYGAAQDAENCTYPGDKTFSGILTLLVLDSLRGIASGEFYFSTKGYYTACDTLVVTKGRFDQRF